MRWAEITVVASDESDDLIANIMIEEGCGGVAITGPSVRASGFVDVDELCQMPTETALVGYLPVDDGLERRLESIRIRIRSLPAAGVPIGPGDITVKWVEDSEWEGAWKSFFKPVEIGDVFVKPSWEDMEVAPDKIVVEIDPGMAFGTGNHPTTILCIKALQKYVRSGAKVLDVGAGSGILSIAAAKLGASEVVGTEIDRIAVASAIRNVRQNRVSGTVMIKHSDAIDDVGRGFDIVIANITANVIQKLAGELGRAVGEEGLIIASGIIESRAEEIIGIFKKAGFVEIETEYDDGWAAIVMKLAAEG